MTFDEYVKKALKTENDYDFPRERIDNTIVLRLLHGAIGACTEAGELIDILKKYLIYGKQIDITNIIEEVGDILWYIAIISDSLGISIETIMEKNINKLQKRYKNKFSEIDAIERNTNKERKALEQE